jgi:putative DNA-invertase from lambdoid prophage Rac
MAVYGYTRVSTERQAEEGESLGAQQRKIDGYAMMTGMTVDTMFIERGVSGSTKVSILAKLQKAGVSLHMIDLGGDVTGNGISKLVFTILSAVAEAERDRIRERVRETKADQRNRGRYLGGKVPFGWLVSAYGELLRNEAQQAAIERMKALQEEGNSLRKIADAMQSEGIKLSHAGVKKVLWPVTSKPSFSREVALEAGKKWAAARKQRQSDSPRPRRVSSASADQIWLTKPRADSEDRE